MYAVLHRQRRHRDVKHVEVLLADQIEQQVERPLEGFEKDFERVRRDVEVVRQTKQRLAVESGERDAVNRVRRRVSCGGECADGIVLRKRLVRVGRRRTQRPAFG